MNQDSEDLISDISPSFARDIMNTHVLQTFNNNYRILSPTTHHDPIEMSYVYGQDQCVQAIPLSNTISCNK